jgi:dihydrodipicolinate synthase/N-acetylneuraminate lyase
MFGHTAEIPLAHFKTIADATDLTLIAVQYPPATGQGYPLATLMRLYEEVPTIRAIKDWTRTLRAAAEPAALRFRRPEAIWIAKAGEGETLLCLTSKRTSGQGGGDVRVCVSEA